MLSKKMLLLSILIFCFESPLFAAAGPSCSSPPLPTTPPSIRSFTASSSSTRKRRFGPEQPSWVSDPRTQKKRKLDQEKEKERKLNGIEYFVDAARSGNFDHIKFHITLSPHLSFEFINQQEKIVQELINTKDSFGHTALLAATMTGHGRIVRFLLEKDIGVNRPNENGMSPFMIACMSGNVELVELLLPHSKPFMKDRLGRTALDIIAKRCQSKEPEYLKVQRLLMQEIFSQ